MRKLPLSLTVIGSTLLVGTTSVGAISSYNASPAPERTETGALVVLWDTSVPEDGVPDRVDWMCSGAMVDADTFLTAAHCTDGWPTGARFFVSLAQDIQTPLDQAAAAASTATQDAETPRPGPHRGGHPPPGRRLPGQQRRRPRHRRRRLRRVGRTTAQTLDFTPAQLPTAGQLDEIGGRALDAAPWTAVGYGTEEALRGPGGHTHPGGGVRLKAPQGFNALNKTWVRLAMNESRGFGGACYGDSGGPNFVEVGGQRLLAGTTITGDSPCYATNVVYRTDSASARAFLAPYVALLDGAAAHHCVGCWSSLST